MKSCVSVKGDISLITVIIALIVIISLVTLLYLHT